MGLFGNKKKVAVNMVTAKDGERTFVHEGDLIAGVELTLVGDAEAKLEGDIVISDGRTLKVDADNKVEDIVEATAGSNEGESITFEAIAGLMAKEIEALKSEMEKSMDAKIQALREKGSTHKPTKGTGGPTNTKGIDQGDQVTARKSINEMQAKIADERRKLRGETI